MGQQRPRDASDLLPPPPPRRPQRRAALRGRPAPDVSRPSGPTSGSGLDVGSDIALANAIGREIIAAGLENNEFIERATERLRGVQGQGRAVHARVRRARDRRPRRRDPRARPRVRDGAAGDDLLDPRHHRAPQRGRQRPRPDRPRPADRARRPLRQRRQPAPRPEQRPGRRRHGRPAGPAAGLPARRERRAPREVRRGRGASTVPPKRGWHLSGMFDAMERGELQALYVHRREPGPVGGRPEAGEAPARRAATSWSSRTSS